VDACYPIPPNGHPFATFLVTKTFLECSTVTLTNGTRLTTKEQKGVGGLPTRRIAAVMGSNASGTVQRCYIGVSLPQSRARTSKQPRQI
jgi:hypothetical protein